MEKVPEHDIPPDLADRVDSALRAFRRGDSTELERLLEAEEGSPGLGGMFQGVLDHRVVPVVGLTGESAVPGYKIIRQIGRGGMGVVYEAEQQEPRRRVALKVLSGLCADEYHVKLFHREIQTLARLRHPAIATIHEAGRTEDGQHFFTMELVEGVPLNQYLRDRRVPIPQRLELFSKICEAVEYAHGHGVIHRDLKPSNILVDGEGNPRIVDFGLARMTGVGATLSTVTAEGGRVVGTLAYMSPEQARGEVASVDARTDVYALGVILYELLTGHLPYDLGRVPPHELVRVICEELPRKPSVIAPGLHDDLETIVLMALAKEPARRNPSAKELCEHLRRYLEGEPVLAKPPSTFYFFLRRKLSKHRLWVALGAAVLVMGLIGLYALERQRERE